jgi:hypothetical protein
MTFPNTNAQEQASSSPLDPVNELEIGEFSGKMQLLFMRRSYDNPDGDASSGTAAFTLNYKSPHIGPFLFGFQGIHCTKLFESGSLDDQDNGAAWRLHNTDFHVMNEAYATMNLQILGMPQSDLTVGRKIATYDFAPTYAPRQKAQALEGVFLKMREWENFDLDIGHIERFSSWSTRDGDGDWLRMEFNEVEDVYVDYGHNDRDDVDLNARPDKTHGLQFINFRTDLRPDVELVAYDLFGANLYNTIGAKLNATLSQTEDSSIVWKNHGVMQQDVGDYDDVAGEGFDAFAIESSMACKKGQLLVEPGIFAVTTDDSLRHAFESTLTWEYTLDWFTRPHHGKSSSAFLKTVYTFGNTTLYALYFGTKHDGAIDAFDQEINVVIKQQLTDAFAATIKGAYGHRDNHDAPDDERDDIRLFLTYNF